MNKNTGEEGFTIPEVLYAIAILSMTIIFVSGISYSAVTLSMRSRKNISRNASLLLIDETLRREFSSITLPYWEREFKTSISEDAIELPFYNGEREGKLRIYTTLEGRSFLEVPGNNVTELGLYFKILEFQLIRNGEGRPLGVDLHYRYQGMPGHLTAAFSSFPIERETSTDFTGATYRSAVYPVTVLSGAIDIRSEP